MPNWCDTTYKAVGSKEAVKKFYDLAMSSWNKSQDDNKGWLGHFVTELGGDWEKVRCRGWIRVEPELNKDGTMCTVFADTAWCEPPEWRHFLESKIPDLKILYLAIETGLDVFATNDDVYDDKYYVDAYPNFPDDPIMTEEEICTFIKKNYQIEVNNIEECNAVAKEINDKNKDGDEFIYINAIESYDDLAINKVHGSAPLMVLKLPLEKPHPILSYGFCTGLVISVRGHPPSLCLFVLSSNGRTHDFGSWNLRSNRSEITINNGVKLLFFIILVVVGSICIGTPAF